MHGMALAFIAQRGVTLRFGKGTAANMEKATELLVMAARKG